ncbi:hypothetical protein EXIGLDRAFT_777151 [Exidia glandulosa HHB12029]|uniref:Uncharacterized protein n=1 Tax=Exidia glandulosa HHB12029 TaxID=1314781 RepID=A0A165D612_EXIGL|nr:hypothetical protein EXIGLDRAFT_777151 [Exidia glandulosa HHB12029]
MLPMHASPHALVRYKVKSSDLFSQNRVIVEDADGNTAWYKERTLHENEVVESVFQNTTPPSLRWSIHTPKRGWYLRLRSPAFPPGAFVHVKPVAAGPGAEVVVGTLQFGCQTFVFDYAELLAGTPRSSLSQPRRDHNPATDSPSLQPLASSSSTPTLNEPEPEARHSYPPTPSHEASQPDLLSVPSKPKPRPRPPPPPMQISQFVLTPTSRHRVRQANDEVQHTQPSLLSRILPSALHEPKANSYTSAFELDVRPPQQQPQHVPDRGVAVPPPRPPPLLTFLDETPVFSVRTTGTIELNPKLEARLGVERSFWITIALAYLEFLEERDAFLASEESA